MASSPVLYARLIFKRVISWSLIASTLSGAVYLSSLYASRRRSCCDMTSLRFRAAATSASSLKTAFSTSYKAEKNTYMLWAD